ncbi:class I SAM-dependent methyltransferase [Streptomyces sp. NPDC046976]|uniref:class I SAM-dependent methyltransferase n=1 Tax=Streptomyces sp. NPDC046976 TaxID=3155258 RepID=UPI0033ED72FA
MTEQQVRELIDAATRTPGEIDAAIDRIGPATVAAVLLDELGSRADIDELTDYPAVVVEFALSHRGETASHTITTDKGRTTCAPGRPGAPDAVVSQELGDLLRGVFGIRGSRTNPTRSIAWHHLGEPRAIVGPPHVFTTVRRLLRGSEPVSHDLSELSIRFGSDKWGLHYYTPHYEKYFAPLADLALNILEIGVGGYSHPEWGGGSLRMWKRFFHRGMIYGVDTFDKQAHQRQRIGILQGDQGDVDFLEQALDRTGPLDIVIDDGSHLNSDVLTSFRCLFPHLRPGGLYIIEDMQTSYWPGFGGSSENLDDPATSVGFTKTLVDGLNHEEFEPPEARTPTGSDRQIGGLHFYHNLLIIEKARNEEGALPVWIPRRPIDRR